MRSRRVAEARPASAGRALWFGHLRAVLEFERDGELGAVGFDFALGIQLHVEFVDFGDPKIPQRFPGPVERGGGGLLPGFRTGTDQFNDFVDALRHVVLPFGVKQDAGCSCAFEPNIRNGRATAMPSGHSVTSRQPWRLLCPTPSST